MKTYVGYRYHGAHVTVRTQNDGSERRDYPLPQRHDLYNHSPDGFEWGYSGSGPAQLALAICADVLGDDVRARRIYQRVKEVLIAPITAKDWTLNEETVRQAIADAEAKLR